LPIPHLQALLQSLHKKKSAAITLGAWVLAMTFLALVWPSSCKTAQTSHPSFTTGKGRRVEIIRASYGTNHSYSTDSKFVKNLRKRLPASISRRLLPRPDKFLRIQRRPGMAVLIRTTYFSITNQTDTGWEVWPDAVASNWNARIVTETGQNFPSRGRYSASGNMDPEMRQPAWILFKFDSMPLREPNLKIQVEIDNEEHEFTVENPIDPTTLSPYKPEPRPWKKSVDGYEIEIGDAYLRPFEGHSVLHLDPHFSRDGKTVSDQVAWTYSLEGSRGVNSLRLSTNEPVWRVNLSFSTRTNAPAENARTSHRASFYLSPRDLDRSPALRPFKRLKQRTD